MIWDMTVETRKTDHSPSHQLHSVLKQLRDNQSEERFNRTRTTRVSAEISQFMLKMSEAANQRGS